MKIIQDVMSILYPKKILQKDYKYDYNLGGEGLSVFSPLCFACDKTHELMIL
jgi:hypothetical protein